MGVSTSLTWYDFGALLTIIQAYHIRFVLEIGVEHGGASAVLASYAKHTGISYRGIDITLNALDHAVIEHHGALIYQRDAWKQETVDEVRGWLDSLPRPALIFVDGGDKPKELRLYTPLIRPGDVIVAHDYRNEYTDDALWGLDAMRRIRADWLDDTLLCAFTRRDD